MSIYQVVVKGALGGVIQLRNIHHYEFFDYVPDSTILQEFVDNLDAAYKTHLQARFNDNVSINSYGARRVDVGGLPEQEFVPTAGAWSGTDANPNLPSVISMLVTFKAPVAYPRTSRSYLFPFTEASSTASGDPEAAARTSAENWGNSVLTVDVTGQLNPDKVTVKYGGTPRVVTDQNELFTVIVNPLWSTMRSRRAGVGI